MRIKSHKNYFVGNQNNNFQSNRWAPRPWWTPQQQPVAQPVSAKLIRLRARMKAAPKAAAPAKAKAVKATKPKRTSARAKKK